MPTQELEVQQPGGQIARATEQSFMDVIAAAARDPQVDVGKMERLLAMRAQEMAREAQTAYGEAMRSAQEEMRPVLRDAENTHTRTKYAKLEKIDKAIRPIYTKHGFALSFGSKPARNPDDLAITCRVSHIQGHAETLELEGPMDGAGAKGTSNKTGIQALGSTATYLRRYLTCMIFNVILTNEDDDGNGGRPPAGLISESQVLNIIEMMKQLSIAEDNERFLAWAGADKVDHIAATNYGRVIEHLKNLIAKKAAEQK